MQWFVMYMMGSMVGRLLLYKVIGQSNTFAVAGYSRLEQNAVESDGSHFKTES